MYKMASFISNSDCPAIKKLNLFCEANSIDTIDIISVTAPNGWSLSIIYFEHEKKNAKSAPKDLYDSMHNKIKDSIFRVQEASMVDTKGRPVQFAPEYLVKEIFDILTKE